MKKFVNLRKIIILYIYILLIKKKRKRNQHYNTQSKNVPINPTHLCQLTNIILVVPDTAQLVISFITISNLIQKLISALFLGRCSTLLNITFGLFSIEDLYFPLVPLVYICFSDLALNVCLIMLQKDCPPQAILWSCSPLS